ncbi:MAG TPA: ATPase domain-containing protein [Nitrososphaerales archaeon]|nr:ATPase domain-containing protein [Nitrososphaerales archaeon]
MQEGDAGSAGQRLGTGISGLDEMLGGGFMPGRVILVLGEPGSGKTILCSQFLNHGALNEDQKGVFIGLNEPKERFMGEMGVLGMNFQKLEEAGKFAYVDATEVKKIPEQAAVGRIPVGGKELGLVNLIDIISEAVEKEAPKRVVVDSVSDLIFRYPKVEERRPVILDIVEALQSSSATCLLTSELLSTGDSRDLQPEEYLAEGVLVLRTLGRGTRSVQVRKMRGSKIDTTPRPYVIRGEGLEVYATEEVYEPSGRP